MVDWSYPLSERHRNLKNAGLYFKQVKLMIKQSGRKNKFRGEWGRTLNWMRRTLRKKKLNSHVRPLTTILSSGILVGEIKLALLYAKINTYIISSRVLVEGTGRTQRLFNRFVIIPALQSLMRVPAWLVGGGLKAIHKLVSVGDNLISKANRKLKPHFDHCGYVYKNWSKEFRKYIF